MTSAWKPITKEQWEDEMLNASHRADCALLEGGARVLACLDDAGIE